MLLFEKLKNKKSDFLNSNIVRARDNTVLTYRTALNCVKKTKVLRLTLCIIYVGKNIW